MAGSGGICCLEDVDLVAATHLMDAFYLFNQMKFWFSSWPRSTQSSGNRLTFSQQVAIHAQSCI